MLPISLSWKIVRDLGPGWVVRRITLDAEARLGILKRRLPASDWNFSSRDWLRGDLSADPERLKQSLRENSRFFFDTWHLPLPRGGDELRKQADRILAGELPYFSHSWFKVGFPPDWHLNVLDGARIPGGLHWSEIDLDSIHDVKFVWEPSRFSFAYLLVRTYAATQDDRYAEAFWTALEDWTRHNPPNTGVNWASGQEAAFRVMAWCFCLFAFLDSSSSTADRVSSLLRMIEVHGERIAGFIDYALSQRNNHGISEAVGLFTIGLLFPQFRTADEWRRTGRDLIVRQIGEQIYEDGSYIQHSFNYQRVMLDDAVWAFRLAELNDCRFPEECYRALERAIKFMLEICSPHTGRMPNYGSNDGTLVLPLSSCDYVDYRPSLQAAHCLVRREVCFDDGAWNEQAEWLFGAEFCSRAKKNANAFRSGTEEPVLHHGSGRSLSAASLGYYKMNARESYAMLRAARYRDRPSQADQLHFDLWWGGENIACDAGTYLYNGPPPWDNALGATWVHNTVTVGGHDQMTRAGRFLWLDWAQAQATPYSIANENAIEAWHDGYADLGATHKRSVMALNDLDCWIVVDDMLGSFRGATRLHWLFPDWEFAWEQDELRLWLQTPAGPFQCCLHTTRQKGSSLVRAGDVLSDSGSPETKPIRGWRSLYYGEKLPALSLTLESESPVRFISVLAPAEIVLVKVDENEVRLRSGERKCLVRLSAAGRTFSGVECG